MRSPSAGRPAPVIDDDRCVACSRCPVIPACRGRAVLRFERDEPPYIDAARCDGCYVCIPACPHDAVVMEAAPG